MDPGFLLRSLVESGMTEAGQARGLGSGDALEKAFDKVGTWGVLCKTLEIPKVEGLKL